jgi:hypothetical protein
MWVIINVETDKTIAVNNGTDYSEIDKLEKGSVFSFFDKAHVVDRVGKEADGTRRIYVQIHKNA